MLDHLHMQFLSQQLDANFVVLKYNKTGCDFTAI